MAIHPQLSFSAGELDPSLRRRTTLQKYQSGLATARNVIVGKTGRLMSRPGRSHYAQCKTDGRRVVLFGVNFTVYLLEWGHQYVRVHNTTAKTYQEIAHDWLETDLDNIQFVQSGSFVYCFCQGKKMKKLFCDSTSSFLADSSVFFVPSGPIEHSNSVVGTPSGYRVAYACDATFEGERTSESQSLTLFDLPINVGEQNNITWNCGATRPDRVRFYRRPYDGTYYGAHGLIGESSYFTLVSSQWHARMVDFGQDADYTQQPAFSNLNYDQTGTYPPDQVPFTFQSRTGCVYGGRLLLVRNGLPFVIEASRPGFQRNFYRNFPLDFDSALTLKCDASDGANVLRLFVGDAGLLAFTTRGIFQHRGVLSPSNLGFEKRGGFVIDERVHPLEVPGEVFFVDRLTNTIRAIQFSEESQNFVGNEISIFSNHLFENKTIRSWMFSDGDTPLVWVTLTDGSMVSLAYQREHEMRSWQRHGGDGLAYEYVATHRTYSKVSTSYCVVEKGGKRFIERFEPRVFSDLKTLCTVDSGVYFNSPLTGTITVTPVTPGDWEGQLTLTASTSSFANASGNGAAGSVFRFYDAAGRSYDLTVDTYTSATVVVATPDKEFPLGEASAQTMFKTYTTLTGLSHLNDEEVSVFADGCVVASPNNNHPDSNYPSLIPSGGSLTLPDSHPRASHVWVGRPFTSDIETLDIDTVEQRPVMRESKIANKIYLSIYRSAGLYAADKFDSDGGVAGMQDVHSIDVNYDDTSVPDVLGDSGPQLRSKDVELIVPADWKSQGRICLRQVDPLPFEILAIDVDLQDLRRG